MEVRDLFESMDYGAAPEADDRARAWLEQRKGILDHYIAGRWRTPESGEYFQTRNPSGGELLAMVADGNEADVNRAVAAAADALEGWVAIGGHAAPVVGRVCMNITMVDVTDVEPVGVGDEALTGRPPAIQAVMPPSSTWT